MASPIAPITEQMKDGFEGYKPESPGDMIDFFKEFPEFFEGAAEALTNLSSRMRDEMPLHPGLADKMSELAATMAGMRDEATDMHRQFTEVHAPDIRRAEEPRQNERAWDVGNG
ncbi:MAG: hypothetical protein JWM19_843 [Actinomycetia bacterium]|nr:hypothetical protein [Actinomycetes bacterium]